MPFDNPYFPQTFDVGTPGAGHIHFANDGSMTLFASDGVTQLVRLEPIVGLTIFGPNLEFVMTTGDPAEPIAASLQALNTFNNNITPNRQPLFVIAGGQAAGAPARQHAEIDMYGDSYDATLLSEIDVFASIINLYSITGGLKKQVAGFDNISGSNGVVHWDGATFTIGNTYPITFTNPGDIRMSRADGTSPGIVTSAGTGGLRIIAIPGSAEVSFNLTPAGIINLGNGATSVGGSVNIRNPSAAPVGQHTITAEIVAGQTGNIFRAVNATNSAVLAAIDVAGTPTFSGVWSNTGATTNLTAPVAGGAGALPATPTGYWTINISGSARRIPFYV